MGTYDPAGKWAEVVAAAAITDDVCCDWQHGVDGDGYGTMRVRGRTDRKAHVFVCELVHGPRPAGMQAAHSCGRPVCFSGAHQRWATAQEQGADKALHGKFKGERNPNRKLTEADVVAIRAGYAGGAVQQALATEYGVSQPTIANLVARKSWPHVA